MDSTKIMLAVCLLAIVINSAPLSSNPDKTKAAQGKVSQSQSSSPVAVPNVQSSVKGSQFASMQSPLSLKPAQPVLVPIQATSAPAPKAIQKPVIVQNPLVADQSESVNRDDDVMRSPSYDDINLLLSDPALLSQALAEENNQRQVAAEQDTAANDIDLTPLAMAEYLLLTGDFKGLEQSISDLVSIGVLTVDEALKYRDAVAMEYEILIQRDLENSAFQYHMQQQQDEEEAENLPESDQVRYSAYGSAPREDYADLSADENVESIIRKARYYDELRKQKEDFDMLLQSILDDTSSIATLDETAKDSTSEDNEPAIHEDESLEDELISLPQGNDDSAGQLNEDSDEVVNELKSIASENQQENQHQQTELKSAEPEKPTKTSNQQTHPEPAASQQSKP